MMTRPHSDLYINLPALKKLDAMLLETLDSFSDTEFWYVDRGILFGDVNDDKCVSLRRPSQRQEEKWWLPALRVPPDGLPDTARKRLQHHRECTNQILKAAMAINNQVLSKMEVPNCYLETLPKLCSVFQDPLQNGKASLGDGYHLSLHNSRPIFARLSSGLQKLHSKHTNNGKDNRSNSKTSWGKVKDFVGDVERRELLSDYK